MNPSTGNKKAVEELTHQKLRRDRAFYFPRLEAISLTPTAASIAKSSTIRYYTILYYTIEPDAKRDARVRANHRLRFVAFSTQAPPAEQLPTVHAQCARRQQAASMPRHQPLQRTKAAAAYRTRHGVNRAPVIGAAASGARRRFELATPPSTLMIGNGGRHG